MALKTQLILALVASVVIATLSMGLISYSQTKSALLEQMTQSELPAQVAHISSEINGQITGVTRLAESLASNTFILSWADAGFPAEGEQDVVKYLAQLKVEQKLHTTSWVDANTGKYWNQDGFLRVMQPERDKWFFKFKDSDKEKSVSVYRSKTRNEVTLFVNYKKPGTRGIAGLGMPLQELMLFLENFRIGETGFVYLVDKKGTFINSPKQRTDRTSHISC